MVAAHDDAGSTPVRGTGVDRWTLLWFAFFTAMLFVPTGLAVSTASTPLRASVAVGTAAAFWVWHWWFAVRHSRWEGRLPMIVWAIGALAFTWALLGMDDRYIFVVYGLYPPLFALLGRYAIPGAVALTGLVFWRQGVLFSGPVGEWAPTVAGSVALALMIGLFVTAVVRQNAARKAALEQLESTQATLAATAHRAGVLEERQRIARELHDTVAQGFTGIVMQLEACEQALSDAPARAAEHVGRAKASARDSLAEMRRAARAMRPGVLDGASLPTAIEATVDRWSQEARTPARAQCEGTPRTLDPDRQAALLRACQEALVNVAKHANAAGVEVRLAYHPDAVELSVHDDGVGLRSTPEGSGDGSGLAGLAERVRALGGDLSIDSEAGRGTTLRATVAAR